MYILIDNYDSFTYNIYQYISELTDKVIKVVRNDKITIEEIKKLKPEGIIISPGPGLPEEAGISVELIKYFAGKIPILGICLGHQAICYAFGGKIVQAKRIVHGKTEDIQLDGKGLFRSLPDTAQFTRYHSLAVSRSDFPEELEITAQSDDGEIMGIRHKTYPVEGVQFHPESVASEFGKKLLSNFLDYSRDPFPFKPLLIRLIAGSNLSRIEAELFMKELTEGKLSLAQIAGFLTALSSKGITPEEIAGCAFVLQKKRVPLNISKPVLDTCGTGGDELGTFNISSFSAVIASACGAVVAKHGNRAVSSISGSADFFRELGIDINLSPEKAVNLILKTGFSFLFAPIYHSAMKHAAQARRELGVKTIMNLLGPLVNPAKAEYQLIGVYSDELCLPVARAANMLGIKKAMVVYGFDGLDEISVSGPTRIVTIEENGDIDDKIFNPETLGVTLHPVESLKGGSAKENAATALELADNRGPDAIKDAVLLNSGAALYVYGIAKDIAEGYAKAKEALESGKVKKKIEEIVKLCKGNL